MILRDTSLCAWGFGTCSKVLLCLAGDQMFILAYVVQFRKGKEGSWDAAFVFQRVQLDVRDRAFYFIEMYRTKMIQTLYSCSVSKAV